LINEESFMSGFEPISLLKLRGSFGQTGNESIPSDLDKTIYRNNNDDRYGRFDLISAGTTVTNIGNPTITWETTNSYDVGIDFGLFNNRLNGSVAYYLQYVEDMILQAAIPPSTGLSGNNRFWDNVGDMKNFGVELELNSVILDRQKFRWGADLNFTTNRNQVVELTAELDRAGSGIINNRKISRKDGRLNAYFMADYAGIDPERGVEMIHEIDIPRYLETGETVKTGRLIPATLDNVSTHRFIHEDKTNNPTWFGGFNNSFSYGNLSLDVLFTFSGGNYIYDYNRQRTAFVHNGQNVILQDLLDNAWRQPGDQASYPQIVWNSTANWSWNKLANDGAGDWVQGPGIGNYSPEQRFYSKWLYKGDFLRLRNIQLAYTFPNNLTERMSLQGLRIFISATNLLTFTDFPGYDPEGNDWIDTVPVPNVKTFTGGLSLKF
jgi:hypothetical protein